MKRILRLTILLSAAALLLNSPASALTSTTILNNGPVAQKVDIVFLGDGFTSAQMAQYAAYVQAYSNYLFTQPPLSDYKNFFNVHRVDVISNQEGTDNNCTESYVDTALDTGFYATYPDCRLLWTYASEKVTAAAAFAPADDLILVLVNTNQYGGAGGGLRGVLP